MTIFVDVFTPINYLIKQNLKNGWLVASMNGLYEKIAVCDSDYKYPGKVFETTNEIGIVRTKKALEILEVAKDNTYFLGFSGWHNLDIICLRKSKFAVLGDISTRVNDFWKKTFSFIGTSPSRQEFVQKFLDELEEDKENKGLKELQEKEFSFNGSFIKKAYRKLSSDKEKFILESHSKLEQKKYEICSELDREGSWLFTDENYQYIRSLVEGKKIVQIRLNFFDEEKFQKIASIFEKANFALDTLYLSNIYDHVINAKDPRLSLKFKACLRSVIKDETVIIDAAFNGTCEMTQNVFQGKNLKSVDYVPRALRKDETLVKREFFDSVCKIIEEDALAYSRVVNYVTSPIEFLLGTKFIYTPPKIVGPTSVTSSSASSTARMSLKRKFSEIDSSEDEVKIKRLCVRFDSKLKF